MAGDSQVVLKRQREEEEEEVQQQQTLTLEVEEEQQITLNPKRQKSTSSSSTSASSSPPQYDNILSLLDEEEEDKLTHQDLSSLITTLQDELSPPFDPLTSSSSSSSSSATSDQFESDVASEGEVDDKERVFRHLLEASDDELGLPSRDVAPPEYSSLFEVNGSGDDVEGLTLTSLDNRLWELEDEAANYYALLQSELFMERDEVGVDY